MRIPKKGLTLLGVAATLLIDAATVLCSAVLLSGAALYNGYPLVYPDTGGYLVLVNFAVRSMFYSMFVYTAHLMESLWTVVFLQSLLVAYLLRLVLREVFGIASRVEFLSVIVLLCVLTSLPWYAGFLMPDIFTPVLVLGLFLLAFCLGRLRWWEQCYVVGLTFVAAVVHYSHIPIAIGLLLIGLIVRVVLRKRAPERVPHLMLPAAVVGAGTVAIVISNYLTLGMMTYSAGGYAFVLARLVADGQAVGFLRENCGTRKYRMCYFLDRMPMNAGTFLWGEDGVFHGNGWLYEREEGLEIIRGTVRRYPLWTLQSAIAHTFEQVVRVETGDGLGSYRERQFPTFDLQDNYPGEFASYKNSRQSYGELANLVGLNRLHMSVVLISVVYCTSIAILLARGGQWLPVELFITIAFALLLNGFVLGAISDPQSRYGSRLIWLVPLVAMASWRQALGLWQAGHVRQPPA